MVFHSPSTTTQQYCIDVVVEVVNVCVCVHGEHRASLRNYTENKFSKNLFKYYIFGLFSIDVSFTLQILTFKKKTMKISPVELQIQLS